MSPIQRSAESLFWKDNPDLTAAPELKAASTKQLGKRLKHRMGLWIALKPDTKGKFHRFKNGREKYRECFVFIDLEAQVRI